MESFTIRFSRNGKEHTLHCLDVEEALNGRYGILKGKTGHLNKVIEIVNVTKGKK